MKPEPIGPPSHATDQTSLSLLQRIRDDDQSAWQRLVDLYGPLVYSWCVRSGLSSHDADEILQEVFTAVARNLDRFRREKPGDSFRGWLRVIARNRIRLFFRRSGEIPQALGGSNAALRFQEVPDAVLEESTADLGAETGGLLRRAVSLLNAEFEHHTMQAFWQTAIDGKSAAEAAAALGMTAGAVRQARYKVLRRLRTEFGDMVD